MCNIVHVTSYLSPSVGGVAPTILALADHQNRSGCVTVVAGLRRSRGTTALNSGGGPELFQGRTVGPTTLGYSVDLRRFLVERVERSNIFHCHRIWEYPMWLARRLATRRQRCLIISPHGMLDPYCLKISRIKKKLGRWLFVDRNLNSSCCLHATSWLEARNLRRLRLQNPIAIIPVGLDTSLYETKDKMKQISSILNEVHNKRIVLFMSRVNSQKGIQYLLQAWGRLCGKFPEWHLVIAGPDENGFANKTQFYFLYL